MATPGPAASSTERDPRLPLAFPLARAAPGVIQEIAGVLGLREKTAAAAGAALASRATVGAQLAAATPVALVALEVLVDCGGRVSAETLADELARRTAVSRDVALRAPSGAPGLLLKLMPANDPRGRMGYALIAEGAANVARFVRGLTLPQARPADDAPGHLPRDARDLLAFAGHCAHRALRATIGGGVNRASLKSALKNTGLDPDRAEKLFAADGAAEVLAARERVEVDGAKLLDRARGASLARHDADLFGWLPERWVPLEKIVRELVRHDADTAGQWQEAAWIRQACLQRLTSRTFVEVIEHGGHTWLRRGAPGGGGGDGHVTPSFEVMLGPAASPSVVAAVALGCELVRLDNVLTYRITPRSVEEGLGAGLPAAELVAALERVGPHGVAANVRAMLDDWIARAKVAHVRPAMIVRVSPAHDEAAAKALGGRLLGRLSPGVLVVEADGDGARPDEALRTAGFRAHVSGASRPARARRADDDERDVEFFDDLDDDGDVMSGRPLPPPQWDDPPCDDELRRRVAVAASNGSWEGQAVRRPPPPAGPLQKAAGASPAAARRSRDEPVPEPRAAPEPEREEALALAARLVELARPSIDRWIQTLGASEAGVVRRALEYPLFMAPILTLKPAYVARALGRARTLEAALAEAEELAGSGRTLKLGYELDELIELIDIDYDDCLDALDELRRGAPADALTRFGPRLAANTRPDAPPPDTAPKAAPRAMTALGPLIVGEPALLSTFDEARRTARPLLVRYTGPEGVTERTLVVEAVRGTGADTMVLGVDADSDEGRAIRVDRIVGAAFVEQDR